MGNPVTSLAVRDGRLTCALPLLRVRETMRPLPIQVIRTDLRGVSGLCRIRGAPTPVIGLAALLGESAGESCRFVRLDLGGRPAALAVEEVLGVRSIDERVLQQLPPLLRGVGTDVVQSIAVRDAELLLVLDAARLLPDEAWETLRAGGAP